MAKRIQTILGIFFILKVSTDNGYFFGKVAIICGFPYEQVTK
jgi:hypothetical protein